VSSSKSVGIEVFSRGCPVPPKEATRIVTASYPAGVRGWIKKRGGLTQKLIYLRGKELAALYPRC
jgi:hypothetical protein